MQECSQAGSHNGGQFGRSTRPRQLRDREVSWEGSRRSKLMSRRTERPYKVDGAGELAPHSAARRSAPEINGPAVQQEFTFLLRETCSPSPSATVGAVARNGCRAGAGVSRGRSTEGNEPGTPDGLTTREGLNLAGRTRPSVVLTRSDEAERLSIWAAIIVAEKEWLPRPLRTARNRRTRTRMYGGVGAGRGNPPGDPICRKGGLSACPAPRRGSQIVAQGKGAQRLPPG